MENNNVQKKTLLRKILWCMMVGSLVLFWVGQWVMPKENRKEESTFHELQADWVQIMPEIREISETIS